MIMECYGAKQSTEVLWQRIFLSRRQGKASLKRRDSRPKDGRYVSHRWEIKVFQDKD